VEGMVPEPLKKQRELPQIPGYRIEGIVGRGATGIVYRARQVSVDRLVALKVLHAELVGSASAAHRLQREARLTARLAHTNIISAIDMGEIDGQWWYAMELVDGISLAERIAERPFSEREALRVFAPILDALQHAFERGVVHRDIKPSNILLERTGRSLLVDLGLAYSDEDPELTKHGATLGTPHYMSPEQARDPKSADAQSDLWSLGATIYHAVTGQTPFRGESVAEILSNVLHARIPDPREHAPGLSNGFVLVLRKLLARDRGVRYRTPSELAADWERMRERRAPEVSARGLDPLAPRTLSGGRRWAVLGGAVLALAGTAMVGWWLWNRGAAAPAPDPRVQTLARLAAVPDGPAVQLSAALSELEQLRASGSYSAHQLDGLETRLVQRLEEELRALQRERERVVLEACEKRDFERARRLARESLRPELARRVGSRALPKTQSDALEAWQKGLGEQVDHGERAAEQLFLEGVDRYTSEILLPELDQREREGDWRGARERLEQGAQELLAAAGLEQIGLRPEVVARGEAALRARMSSRRAALDAAWQRQDSEWVAWIRAREAELQRDLEQRSQSQASDRLQADAELRGWLRLRPPSGLVVLSSEELVRARERLASREERLREEDSLRLVRELDAQASSLWKARDYEAVRALYAGVAPALLRGEAAVTIPLRLLEADRLQSLLARAAKAVLSGAGSRREVLVGTLPLQGRIEVDQDPLFHPFAFAIDSAPLRRLALRERAAREGTLVLSTAGLLQLVALSPKVPADRLTRALFLFREAGESDTEGLAEAGLELDRAPLSAEDPLVAELGRLLAQSRNRTMDAAQRERRAREAERLALLRRMLAEGSGPDSALTLARDLLGQKELWTEEELVFLRQTRDSLEAARALAADPLRLFGDVKAQELGGGRIRFAFDFARGQTGSFAIGSWLPDGAGWAAARTARDDADFLGRPSPTLPLAGIALQKDELEVRLVFHQPEDSRAELLLVSVAGFHVVFFGQSEDLRPRILVDTVSAERALSRARGGEGVAFAGWKPGARIELGIVVSQARGSVEVRLGGKPLLREDVVSPRSGGGVISVRSWERVRMSSGVVEAKIGR